jgi:predicted Ser/Thr protein kinase
MWRVIRILGEGEHGKVYLVSRGGVKGAMKVVPDTPSARRELVIHRKAASIGFAPRILDHGKRDGDIFWVMEVVRNFL